MHALRTTVWGAALAAVVATFPAAAYEAGDFIVRLGAAGVYPNDESDSLNAIAGSEVAVDNTWSAGITLTYMATDRIGVGLLGAWPFKHDLEGAGTISNLGDIGETKQLPPTLTLQWHFPTGTNIHPYVGAGVNYTYFFSEDTKGALNGTKIDLESSFGPAAEAGVDIELSNGWLVSGQVWYIDIDTEATLSGGPLTLNENVDVDVDPLVFMIGVGKKF